MKEYMARSLELQSKPSPRRDEWALINEQKALEEQTAKMYEQMLEDQKRRKLKSQLDQQVKEKMNKEQYFQKDDARYAEISIRNAKEAQYQEELRKKSIADKRKQMENENQHLFSDIVDSKIREMQKHGDNSMDIGYQAQLERNKKREEYRRQMIDELDRQIKEKEMEKHYQKREDKINYQQDVNIQNQKFKTRQKDIDSHKHGLNSAIYQTYQQIKDKEREKEREFERNQVEEAGRRKLEEQIRKAEEKDWNKRYMNKKMRQVLDSQIKIKEMQKRQEQKVNPEELTYGTIGKMLTQRRSQDNKREYYEDLRRQIQQKKKRKQEDKYMTEQQYRLNINHLNRVVGGSYPQGQYLDRSIHALSDSHKVNLSLIDTHLDHPEAEIVRRRLEDLKARHHSQIGSPIDNTHQHNI